MPRTERLAFFLGLVIVGLGVSRYLPLPSPVIAVRPPGAYSIIGITLSPTRQVSLVVALLACGAVDAIMRERKLLAGATLADTAPYWVLPALLLLWAFTLYEGLARPMPQVLGLAGAALAIGLVVVAQVHVLDLADPWFGPARLALNAVAYGLALAAYFLAQAEPSRGLVATPLIAVVSAFLALAILASPWASARRTWGSALLVGLMMGEVSWALSPGVVSPLVASFCLLLVFYALTGILQQRLWGRLQRRVVFEFLAVAAIALALVLKLTA